MTSRTRGTARKLSTIPACNVPGLQAARVADHILHDCRGAIQRDFLRVSSLIDCDLGVPPDWLRGRSPTMQLAQFQARWCHRAPRGPLPCGVRPHFGVALDGRAPCASPHGGYWLSCAPRLAPSQRRAPGLQRPRAAGVRLHNFLCMG